MLLNQRRIPVGLMDNRKPEERKEERLKHFDCRKCGLIECNKFNQCAVFPVAIAHWIAHWCEYSADRRQRDIAMPLCRT